MSIKLDWQIIEEDETWVQASPPEDKPKRRVPCRLLLVLALIPIVAIGAFAAYVAWTYHAQLNQVAEPVQQVARLELQSVAINDRTSFMALQDPNDAAWRAWQEQNFGRLERTGMPEFGWGATDVAPQIGRVSLEPGGALAEVTYQFVVTQPLPGGPTTVTLQVPGFYKPTPSGWVHAMPGTDFWGAERSQSGKHITVLYYQRDAGIVEPLIPRMEDLVARLCASLPCPPQVSVVFDNSVSPRRGFFGNGVGNSNRSGQDFSGGNGLGYLPRSGRGSFGDGPVTLRLPSPYLSALPTDTNSRDELYRAFETRLAQMVVSQAFGRNLSMNRLASQVIMQWELARVGLTGPFITQATRAALTAKLEAGVTQPLATLSLRPNSFRMDTSDAAMMSLAFAFLDQSQGTGTVERLIPAMRGSMILGDAIHTALQVDPETLEPAWQNYLRDVARLQDQPRQGALSLVAGHSLVFTIRQDDIFGNHGAGSIGPAFSLQRSTATSAGSSKYIYA
jgi:hypothetical protein